MTVVRIPESLQSCVDALIAGQYEDRLNNAALNTLQEYLEGDGWDDLIEASGERFVLNLRVLAEHRFDDVQARDELMLEPSHSLTDFDRISYARDTIRAVIEEFDGYFFPFLVCCRLESRDGQSMILTGYSEIHGQAGPVTEWIGAFRTDPEIVDALQKNRLVLLADVEKLSAKEILDLWSGAT
jgi:hypothetical protein